jgi:NAD(P)-dependent dehydrogenase (short-subunit alcohol dehydrogenase family)
MTRHMSAYWAADNVRVNCLSPGPFPNDTARELHPTAPHWPIPPELTIESGAM